MPVFSNYRDQESADLVDGEDWEAMRQRNYNQNILYNKTVFSKNR